MPMDAYREGEVVHVWMDVPGVKGDDLDVTVEKQTLTVTAQRSWEPGEDTQILASERSQGSFRRSVQLGENLDTDGLEASYEDGVLHLVIPVADKAKPRRVEIGRQSS
jgi:HSP20 family protein